MGKDGELPSQAELATYLKTEEARQAIATQLLVSNKETSASGALFVAGLIVRDAQVAFGARDPRETNARPAPLFGFQSYIDGTEKYRCRVGTGRTETEIGYKMSPLSFFPIGSSERIVWAQKLLRWYRSPVPKAVENNVVTFPGC